MGVLNCSIDLKQLEQSLKISNWGATDFDNAKEKFGFVLHT